ncbi:MAG: ABC transporter permease [Candidatus Hydrogenedentes bacterium]|nr:ABC transporter permease [Candidatus Hydrogenedentota bacterium]
MLNLRRMAAIARKESLHVMRDWRSLYLAMGIPVALILLFGYALNMDLENVPTAVWDQSRTPESRELLSFFDGSPYYAIESYHDGYDALETALLSRRVMIALVIPSDFADKLHANRPVAVQVISDGSDATTARLALGYASALGLIYNHNLLAERIALMGRGPLREPLLLDARAWYNPDLRSENDIIPGIIAVVLIVISAMLTSVTVAREWEMGTMEQLISTPIRVPEIVLGKVFPYFVIGMADITIAMLMGRLLFHVPLRGHPALVFATGAIFLTGALFLGLMLSINLKKQVLANQIALFVSYLPTLLLSGFVFAIENMPRPLQLITYIVPARYFIALLRGIYLKGIGLEVLWLNALLLAIYAAFMVIMAHKRMKLKLE